MQRWAAVGGPIAESVGPEMVIKADFGQLGFVRVNRIFRQVTVEG